MKKIILSLLITTLIIPVFGIFNRNIVKGENACGMNYEVAYIEDDGAFSNVACYEDFASAKKAMKELGEDYVVRQENSLSPSKIIAMNSGVAYSYPGRGNSKTMNIYQHVTDHSSTYKKTYIANHYEMYYVDTERYFIDKNGNGVGMVEVSINGFDGYADLEYTDLVPSKFLDNGIAIYLGGNNTYEGEEAFLVTPFRNYYEVVKNGNYLDLVFRYCRAYPEKENINAISSSIVVGKASEQMKEGIKYYSKDGVNFYTDASLEGTCITYYNYYEFLPLRSKTNISCDVLNNYIKNKTGSVLIDHGQDFIDAQNNYGVNALLLFAMAIHESNYGTSNYAKYRNNLFGWNAVDNNPSSASSFESVYACINQQASINLRGFLDINDSRFFSSSLGNKGSGLNVQYASDPYWGMKIAGIAYAIDKASKNKDGTYTDLDNYHLALINDFDIKFKKEANKNSTTLYTSQYGPYYQKDFIVINLGKEGDYTKVQSTNAIDNNGNVLSHRTNETLNSAYNYDYDLSVAYIESKYLNDLNYIDEIGDESVDDELKVFSTIDSLEIKDNNLIINGCAFIKGTSFDIKNKISHEILVKNIADDKTIKTYVAESKKYEGIKFNDNHIYDYVGYNISIPLNELNEGNYYLMINIKNRNVNLNTFLHSYDESYANLSKKIDNKNYHLTTNEIYNNRLEIDVDSLPSKISYAAINKPSTRPSLFSFDKFTLDENGNLYIYGQAMIYYTNFNSQNNVKYKIYLIDDEDNYLEIKCTTLKSNYNYQSLLKSSYNMDYICFEASANIKNLKEGFYQMIIKIENGNYLDYLEMSNVSQTNVPSADINNMTYRFFTSRIRDRLMLEVSQ